MRAPPKTVLVSERVGTTIVPPGLTRQQAGQVLVVLGEVDAGLA